MTDENDENETPPKGNESSSKGNVNESLDRIGKAMQAAWARVKKAQTRLWGEWMTIGEGLLEGRRWAMRIAGVNRPEGKGYVTAYGEWLKRYKVDDMDRADRAKLLQLMEDRPAVEEWRSTLTDNERRSLNNPTLVWRKWTAATRTKKPKPRTAGYSATEMGRARDMVQQQDERIRELEEELAAAREQADDDPKAIVNRFIDFVCTLPDEEANAYLAVVLDNVRSRRQGKNNQPSPASTADSDLKPMTWTPVIEDGVEGWQASSGEDGGAAYCVGQFGPSDAESPFMVLFAKDGDFESAEFVATQFKTLDEAKAWAEWHCAEVAREGLPVARPPRRRR